MQTLSTTGSLAPLTNALEGAVEGRIEVRLYTKGFRHMYVRGNPAAENFLAAILEPGSKTADVPVSEICQRFDVDPQLVDDVFFYYRGEEVRDTDDEELKNGVWEERRQIITNLFPFPAIRWLDWRGYQMTHGQPPTVLGVVRKTGSDLDIEELLRRCRVGKQALERVVCPRNPRRLPGSRLFKLKSLS